jgi:hypothetical protein
MTIATLKKLKDGNIRVMLAANWGLCWGLCCQAAEGGCARGKSKSKRHARYLLSLPREEAFTLIIRKRQRKGEKVRNERNPSVLTLSKLLATTLLVFHIAHPDICLKLTPAMLAA